MGTMFGILVGLAVVYCFNNNYETEGFIRRHDKPMDPTTYEIKRKK